MCETAVSKPLWFIDNVSICIYPYPRDVVQYWPHCISDFAVDSCNSNSPFTYSTCIIWSSVIIINLRYNEQFDLN